MPRYQDMPCEVCGAPVYSRLKDLVVAGWIENDRRAPLAPVYEVHSMHQFCAEHHRGSITYDMDGSVLEIDEA